MTVVQRATGSTSDMASAMLTPLEWEVVESVLEMSSGYLLDFNDRKFADFFANHGVQIDEEKYKTTGTSKAKRFRVFLRTAEPPLVAKVLAELLEYRQFKDRDGLKPSDVKQYRKLLARLSTPAGNSGGTSSIDPEAELLRLVLKPEQFGRLPVDQPTIEVLLARVGEARVCTENGAYLAAVILCGSILEGICLGFGGRHPAHVNRAYHSQYNKPPPKFYDWKLREWIEVLGRLGVFTPNIEKFGHALRDFRNYVHPAEQLAHRFSPDQHTARISFQVVLAAVDDMVKATAGLRDG